MPERVAMQLTGHKTHAVFERYNIVSPGDLRDAARRLDTYSATETRDRQKQISAEGVEVAGAIRNLSRAARLIKRRR